MKNYMLNNLGAEWTFYGHTEEEVEVEYLSQMQMSREKYDIYCQDLGIPSVMIWKEV